MRVSRTVLREAEGVTPSAYSPSRNSRKGPEGRRGVALRGLKSQGGPTIRWLFAATHG